jgi:hypothetical protein
MSSPNKHKTVFLVVVHEYNFTWYVCTTLLSSTSNLYPVKEWAINVKMVEGEDTGGWFYQDFLPNHDKAGVTMDCDKFGFDLWQKKFFVFGN